MMKSKTTLSADNVPYTEDILNFIASYFASNFSVELKTMHVSRAKYSFNVDEREGQFPLLIEDVSFKLNYQQSETFCIALLEKFNIDWRPLRSLEFEIESGIIPEVKITVYPLINALSRL